MGFFSNLFSTPKVELASDAGVVRNISTPGADISRTGGVVSLTPSVARDVAVRGLGETGFAAGRDIRGLREQVAPGFGALTRSRVEAVQAARSRGIGNLRENLARRRVRGSSFGEDALIRAEREFGQEEARVRAQSVLEELDLTRQLISDESEVKTKALLSQLTQMNFETSTAAGIANVVSEVQQRSAEARFNAAAKAAQGQAGLFGQALSFGGAVLGGALGGSPGASLGNILGGKLGGFFK